jgi:Type IIA topoisomerase (DNA gyrase/topo II, topoisomerase IV), B subunit
MTHDKENKINDYNENSIDILEGLEAVRKRPGMYIGTTTSRGLHHCVWEILDNSNDEHLAGFCKEINISILKNGSVSVEDDGRGVPVGVHPKKGFTTERVIYTILHAGGKFGGNGYKVAGGLHGVGGSVVNALSEYFEVEIYRDGNIYFDRYENGGHPVVALTPKGELKSIGKTEKTGTKVTWKPDGTIFETVEFKAEVIKKKLKETSYLNRGLKINFYDERTGEREVFHEEQGIVGFINEINEDVETITEPIYLSGSSNDIEVEVAFQYTKEFNEQIISYCNNISTVDGGTHVTGIKTSITRVINSYAKELGMIKEKDGTFDGRDVRNGLVAIVSIKHTNPQYEGQTKTKLGNSDAKSAVDDVFSKEVQKFFDRNVETLRTIIDNALKSFSIRKAEDKAKDMVLSKEAQRKNNGKIAYALLKDPEILEIIIVEGDSAGGSAKQGRDRRFQAVLPLKGKVTNVEKKVLSGNKGKAVNVALSVDKVLSDDEIATFVTALGCGLGNDFDMSKIKYARIIILTDADVDGSHIRTLLLTLIYRYMPQLLIEGRVFKGIPPLYKIVYETNKGKKKVEEVKYAYSDNQLNKIKKELGSKIKSIQRYKGLGEMDPHQLWETTLNPETRVLAQIPIEDAIEADKITKLLMGDKVEPRRDFIMAEAPNANVDA